jgi:cysteine desulfurase / selenocysteine lyase
MDSNNLLSSPTKATPFTEAELLAIREQFPVLKQRFFDKPLTYLDSGATTQKPQRVIDRMTRFLEQEYATVRRGVYALSDTATQAYWDARATVAQFLGADSSNEIVFVRGCTEALNLLAFTAGRSILKAGDGILLSGMEHHANLVPWQRVAEERGFTLHFIPVLENGELNLEAAESLLQQHPIKLVSVIHVSNVLGTVNPVKRLAQLAHQHGAVIAVDGAQSAPHQRVDVQDLDCDFFAFSGHKTYGPTGIGVFYGKYSLLEQLPPYQGGGDMIETVTLERSTYAEPPRRFEAGTPALVEAVGLAEALKFLMKLGLDRVEASEQVLLKEATEKLLAEVPELTIVGNAPHKAGVISFTMESAHASDIGTLLDHEAIALRTGHHCAQPLMARYGVSATARASFGVYNTQEDVNRLVEGLRKVDRLCRG